MQEGRKDGAKNLGLEEVERANVMKTASTVNPEGESISSKERQED